MPPIFPQPEIQMFFISGIGASGGNDVDHSKRVGGDGKAGIDATRGRHEASVHYEKVITPAKAAAGIQNTFIFLAAESQGAHGVRKGIDGVGKRNQTASRA